MNPKNSKKSPIHENADANIIKVVTCDFGDGDISRSRSFLSNTIPQARTARRRHDPQSVDFLNLIVDNETQTSLQVNMTLLSILGYATLFVNTWQSTNASV